MLFQRRLMAFGTGPACMATVALMVAGATSAGGMTALVAEYVIDGGTIPTV